MFHLFVQGCSSWQQRQCGEIIRPEDQGAVLARQGKAKKDHRLPNFTQWTRAQATQSWPCHAACSLLTITIEIHMQQLVQSEHCCAVWDCNGKSPTWHEVSWSSYASMKRPLSGAFRWRGQNMHGFLYACRRFKKTQTTNNTTPQQNLAWLTAPSLMKSWINISSAPSTWQMKPEFFSSSK